MGREVLCHAEVGAEAGEVRALLETTEILLRGDIRRRFPRPAPGTARAQGGALVFASGGEQIRLYIGEKPALAWEKILSAPPPGLRDKLGISPDRPALFLGPADDPALAEAIQGALTADAAGADMILAVILDQAALDQAIALQARHPHLALWAIYPKGKPPGPNDAQIRSRLRGLGLIDTKSCSVSERLTATRYAARKA